MTFPEVYVKKVNGVWQLWINSHSMHSPAGPRLLKGATRSFVNGPPDFLFSHDNPKQAYTEAERLQLYLMEWNET